MLTKIRVRNFKQFEDSGDIELGQTVVFVGPNNSGKTTVLQALTLWEFGTRLWSERRSTVERKTSRQRSGVPVNRKDLLYIPAPEIDLLWLNRRQREGKRQSGSRINVYIQIEVEGTTHSGSWKCGIEFYDNNSEVLYCRPMDNADAIPFGAEEIKFAFLPPMSGLASQEDKFERGSIQRRIGEGRTAEVLRNLCYLLYEVRDQQDTWKKVCKHIKGIFGAELIAPTYNANAGVIDMLYKDRNGAELDLSSAGRGMLQVLLLLAYLYTNENTILLLDEPDAHLETMLQKTVYDLIRDISKQQGVQVIAATHSEIVMERAYQTDTLISFIGKPHRIDSGQKQDIGYALKEVHALDCYLVEKFGWVLYVEDFTDIDMLRAFAQLLRHSAEDILKRAFVHELKSDDAGRMNKHFRVLNLVKSDLKGIAILDKSAANKGTSPQLQLKTWQKCEIENYLIIPEALEAYAKATHGDEAAEIMKSAIVERIAPIDLRNRQNVWWKDTKMSDFLDDVFRTYSQQLGIRNPMQNKRNFYEIIPFIPITLLDTEVSEKLDAIVEVAKQAKPREN